MKARLLVAGLMAASILAGSFSAEAQTRKFTPKPGSLKMRIEGTSTMHPWQVESKIIGGSLDVGANFPTQPGQEVKPGKADAKVEAFVPARSLTSIEKDGTPYSKAMDDIMHGKLKVDEFQRIVYKLDELVLKEAPKAKDQPYVFDATGQLAVAGVTNKITMPVNVTPTADGALRITGTTQVKMTDFKIEPPAPAIAGGLIKTGDDVKLLFDWVVIERKAK